MRVSETNSNSVVSRRTVIGAGAASPVLGGVPHAAEDTVTRCAQWIALDLEIDRLTMRWAKLEALMAREFGWFALTDGEQKALPEAAEMFEIDARLEALSHQRERLLKPLSHLRAHTLHGVTSKLVIAARLVEHEENPAQPFVANAIRELADMCCAGCGAAYVPAGVTTRCKR
jgi:hypothetical protein